jgi:hypothetical protein
MMIQVIYTKNGKRYSQNRTFVSRPHFGDMVDVEHDGQELTLRATQFRNRLGDHYDAIYCSVADDNSVEVFNQALQEVADA